MLGTSRAVTSKVALLAIAVTLGAVAWWPSTALAKTDRAPTPAAWVGNYEAYAPNTWSGSMSMTLARRGVGGVGSYAASWYEPSHHVLSMEWSWAAPTEVCYGAGLAPSCNFQAEATATRVKRNFSSQQDPGSLNVYLVDAYGDRYGPVSSSTFWAVNVKG